MTDKQKNVPYRRFKEFKNADAWEQRKLSDLMDVRDGTHDSPKYQDHGFPLVTSKNLTEHGLDLSDISFVSENDFNDINRRSKVEVGDIIFGMIGTIGNPVLLKQNNFAIKNVALLKKGGKVENTFLIQLLKSPVFKRYLDKENAGGTQKFLGLSKIRDFEFMRPEFEEQDRIGSFFERFDNLITLHQRKYDKLKKLKSAYLTEMFPAEGERKPKRRFSGFTDDWEQRKLGDIVSFFSGLTYTPADVVSKPGTLVLRSSNVKDNTIINADDVYVKSEAVNSANVQNGDVIVVVRNGSRNLIGKHAEVKKEMANTVIGAFMTGVRYDTPNFVNALFDTNQFKIEISKNLGATINQITTGNFKNMLFKFPTDNNEQNKIGEFFSQLDHLITLHQQQLEKLKNLKQAYLNEMFV